MGLSGVMDFLYRMTMSRFLSPVVAIHVLDAAPMQGQETTAHVNDHAQPARAAASASSPGTRLPVRRVVLYKSGVGYFEHLGRVRGNQTVAIDFTSGQLNDVLKSLTTLDLDGGRVLGVSYNSEAGLERRLGALRLPVRAGHTRGAAQCDPRSEDRSTQRRATTTSAGCSASSVRRSDRTAASMPIDTLSLVTDGGELQSVVARSRRLGAHRRGGSQCRRSRQYLSLVASAREQDVRRLTIATSGTGDRDLFVSYISEVPVWKADVPARAAERGRARKPLLQGWAIVDNTVGEDWENVELSLVAGAPQSFIQAISTAALRAAARRADSDRHHRGAGDRISGAIDLRPGVAASGGSPTRRAGSSPVRP